MIIIIMSNSNEQIIVTPIIIITVIILLSCGGGGRFQILLSENKPQVSKVKVQSLIFYVHHTPLKKKKKKKTHIFQTRSVSVNFVKLCLQYSQLLVNPANITHEYISLCRKHRL